MKTSQSTPKKKHGAARIGAGLRSLQQFLAERQVGIRHQDKDRLISEYRDWLRHAHESIGEADPSFEPTFKAIATALDLIQIGATLSHEQNRDAVYGLHKLIDARFPASADAPDLKVAA